MNVETLKRRNNVQQIRHPPFIGSLIFALLIASPGVASSNEALKACLEEAKNNYER